MPTHLPPPARAPSLAKTCASPQHPPYRRLSHVLPPPLPKTPGLGGRCRGGLGALAGAPRYSPWRRRAGRAAAGAVETRAAPWSAAASTSARSAVVPSGPRGMSTQRRVLAHSNTHAHACTPMHARSHAQAREGEGYVRPCIGQGCSEGASAACCCPWFCSAAPATARPSGAHARQCQHSSIGRQAGSCAHPVDLNLLC